MRFLSFVLSIFLMLISADSFAANQCSPYITKAVLNEVFFKKTGVDRNSFIEVKLLDSTFASPIAESVYDQWKIRICDGNNSCSTKSLSLAAEPGTGSTYPWRYIETPSLDDSYISFNSGFDLALLDENDDYIDYIQVKNKSYQTVSCSNFAYVFSVPTTQNGTKLLHRLPDGTGEWVKVNAAQNNTPGSGNSGATFPYITISDATASQGNPLTFTVSLVDENGDPTTVNNTVSFRYKSIDGTAIGGTHFDTVSYTSAEIPANLSSFTLPIINTNLIGDQVTREFTLFIDGSSAANISDGFGLGTITPYVPPTFGCDSTFVDGATSHSASGNIGFASDSYILGNPDTELQSSTVTNAANTATCNNVANCTASGIATTAVSLGAFQATDSSERRDAFTGTDITIGDDGHNEFYVVNVESGGTLRTSNTHSVYFMRSLFSYGFNASIYLAPGDYYIEYLTIGTSTRLYITEPGEVRIFVKNNLNIGASSELNYLVSDDYQLRIASYGDIDVGVSAKGEMLLHAEGDITLGHSAHVYGAVSATNVSLDVLSRVDYQCGASTPVIDHYQIIHDTNGLTCESEPISIKACTNAFDGSCTESTDSITLDLVATGTTHNVTKPVSLTGSTNVNLDYTVDETVILSIDNASIAPNNGFICNGNNAGDCELTFADAGFKIEGHNPIEVAGIANGSVTIQAVKADDSGACVPLFNQGGNKNIDFAVKAVTPARTTGLAYKVGTVGSHVDIPKYTTTPSSFQSINLAFDNQSKATLPPNVYLDAGIINLYAQYVVPATVDNPALTIFGNSSNFTVRPDAFSITPRNDSGSLLAESSANGATTQKAGVGFDLLFEAINADWLGDGTPDRTINYTAINVDLALQRNHADLVVNSMLSDDTGLNLISDTGIVYSDAVTFTNGYYQSNTKSAHMTEVGVYTLHANEQTTISPDNSSSKAYGSSNLGRFTPAYFIQSIESGYEGSLRGNHHMGCLAEDWVYTGQQTTEGGITKGSMRYVIGDEPKLTIKAYNGLGIASGNITKNYIGDFQKLAADDISLITPTTNDHLMDSDILSQGNLADFNDGSAIYTLSDEHHFTYRRDNNSKRAPFDSSFRIPIDSIIDSDGIAIKANDASGPYEEDVLFNATLGNTLNVRFGRWQIDNAYGPETELLPVSMTAQQWSGVEFTTNVDDSCTTPTLLVDPNNAKVDTGAIWSGGLALQQYRLFEVDGSIRTEDTFGSVLGSFQSGVMNDINNRFEFSVPNVQGTLSFELEVPMWLKYDWQADGGYDENPSAILSFGLFRGNDRIISWREIGN